MHHAALTITNEQLFLRQQGGINSTVQAGILGARRVNSPNSRDRNQSHGQYTERIK